MAEFDDVRQAYAAARAAAAGAQTELIRAGEAVKRLRRAADALARQANQGSGEAAAARLQELRKQVRQAEAGQQSSRDQYREAQAGQLQAFGRFSVFTDPTAAVERLPDDAPMLLMPLRLEARFKTRTRDGAAQRFLWVRVFPDDILVDTFQPEISATELSNVTIYWTHKWRAGGDAAGHRAAWAALVKSHGSGRAKWLIDRIAPLNPDDEPVADTGKYFLIILPAAPLPAAEKPVIARFWERVWSSAGAERDAAFAEMAAALGDARATSVEAELAPVNLRDVAVAADGTLTPEVAFLDLPDPATLPLSTDAWTRGAHTWLLPERLVLLGFRDGKEVLRQVGQPIPPDLHVGPDPAAEDADQIKADGADLEVPEALRWTVDFDTAVAQGMGFVVNLSTLNLTPQFDRLFVLGVRVGSDRAAGAEELSTLIGNHQGSRKGFTLLPQGRPTNNTDVSSAGYTWWEDPNESFTHFFETDPNDDPGDWRRRKDGAWLAGLLGLDPAVLQPSPNYHGTDQAEARAMNVALWPATLGYYMEQMLEPVFSERTVRDTREFFNRFVVGRGTLPLVRVGRQPYGILPATAWSRISWFEQAAYTRSARKLNLPDGAYLAALRGVVERGVTLWRELARRVANVGEPGADAQQTLLDIVGLHPVSAEFYQRYSQSFTEYYNLLGFATEPVSAPVTASARRYVQAGLLALAEFGWSVPEGGELPALLEKIFLRQPSLLKGNLVQAELSDTAPLSATRADGMNYIAWLQAAARTSHDALRRQEGFSDGVPTALLYMMLRHALDLGYVDTGLQLRREALKMSDAQFRAERKEPNFIQVAQEGGGRSRWTNLYRPEPAVTGDPAQRLGDFIPGILLTYYPYLNAQLAALDVLKDASSGALERALVEHIDCLSYRLDAWRLGLQAVQLAHLREETGEGYGQGGIYIGAYGWLEDLAPKEETLQPVVLDAELAAIFDDAGAVPLMQDANNHGHIHAPSLDHAVTAAMLRNGHVANATPEAPDLLAVDLSSERVRLAQQVIEGMRNGQSLGALLGYRLERALHDEPDLFLDRLIYDLRRDFPLVGNRNRRTRVPGLARISQVEARNVLDGAAFMDHIAAAGAVHYPYGLGNLPPLSEFTGPGLPSAAEIGAIIDGHVAQMRSVGDAVGDLGVAEGVYQVVRGNYDRSAGALDAFSKGTHPPDPEVTATPRRGKTLTHRIGLHLAAGLSPADPANTTPRAQGEPALAQWLARQMPNPAGVYARVRWSDAAGLTDGSLTPSMADLGLASVDLFYMLDAGGARDMPGFDDLLIDYAECNGAPAPRADALFTIEYKPDGVAGLSLFELAPLVRALRGLVLGAPPLRPTDLALQSEAGAAEDEGAVVRADKAQTVLTALQATRPAVDAFIAALDAAIGDAVDPEVARDAARDHIDAWIVDYAALLRPVAPFGLRAASLTTAVEGRRRRYGEMHAAIGEIIRRWESKQANYDTVMADYAALPGGAMDEERTRLLVRAGRIVSTRVIAPLPPTIAALESEVAALRATLDTELGNLQVLRAAAVRAGATLAAFTAFLPTLESIDQTPVDIAPWRDSLLALAQELVQKATALRDDIDRRTASATDALARAATALGDKAQAAVVEAARAILGEAFVLLPEFTLSAERLAEWDNVWSRRADLLAHLQGGPAATPFPVEDWLHGVARVRERLRSLESVTLLGEALGAADEPALEALQFPYRANDAWMGLRFPDSAPDGGPFVVEEDKLLYSAHFGPAGAIDPTQPAKTYGGLLLDEWVEVIPADQETTGLAFHFDRPNAEAPQAMLLVTPPAHRGSWQWQDLVDALHETLDFARLRAVEPAALEQTALGPLLPAVISAVTLFPITAMLNLAFNNDLHLALMETSHE